jgi:hypothetical protein
MIRVEHRGEPLQNVPARHGRFNVAQHAEKACGDIDGPGHRDDRVE